jgi:hypothetical protein
MRHSKKPGSTRSTFSIDDLKWKEYVVNAALFTFGGDHAEADVNGLGVAASIVFGLTGFDAYKDLLDLEYAVENWEWSWAHTGGTALTVVGLIPVIGVVKNLKGTAALSELRNVEDVSNVPGDVKAIIRNGEVKVSGEVTADVSATLTKKSSSPSDVIAIKCFARDTPVLTESGIRPIATIKPGERVMAHNFASGQWEPRSVTERLDNVYEGDVLSIEAGGDRIEATIHHPFWVVEGEELADRTIPRELAEGEDEGQSIPGRWVDSHELRIGDILLNRLGERTPVTAISKRHEDRFEVTNLTIEDAHNYSVGNGSLLVHNTSICSETIQETRGFISSGSKTVDEAKNEFYTAASAKGVDIAETDAAWKKVWGEFAQSSQRGRLATALGPHNYPVAASAHHIFPVHLFESELGRRLHYWGIDLNGASNGVWLPTKDFDGRTAVLHLGNHIQTYYDEVTRLLNLAQSREDALSIIDSIRHRLLNDDLQIQHGN